jgi:hypothetical protein
MTMFFITMSRETRSSNRTPRSDTPRVWPFAVTKAWRSSVTRTCWTSGVAFSVAISSGVACRMPSRATTAMWPFMPMIRLSNCWRKPPITESTTINVATPSATPINENTAMKDTNPSRWRVAR